MAKAKPRFRTVSLSAASIDMLDKIVEHISGSMGIQLSRSAVLRRLIVYEARELGLTKDST